MGWFSRSTGSSSDDAPFRGTVSKARWSSGGAGTYTAEVGGRQIRGHFGTRREAQRAADKAAAKANRQQGRG
jgi:hypothetical protein